MSGNFIISRNEVTNLFRGNYIRKIAYLGNIQFFCEFNSKRAMFKLQILTFITFVQILSLANSKPNEPKLKCPKYWYEYKGYCYLKGKKEMTYLEAQEFCKTKLNSTQLAPIYGENRKEVFEFESMKKTLRKTKNICEEFTCTKWWLIRNDLEEKNPTVEHCVELVQTEQHNFVLHKYAGCSQKKRPTCGQRLEKLEEE